MSKVSAVAPKFEVAVTPELPFFGVGLGERHLFSVREGVPIEEALNQALMLMHATNDILDVVTNDPDVSDRLSWGGYYLNQMARATVSAVVSALDAADRAGSD